MRNSELLVKRRATGEWGCKPKSKIFPAGAQKPTLARRYGKHPFPDTGQRSPKEAIKTGPNVYGKSCRIAAVTGNRASDVSRRNFLGFGRTPPSWPPMICHSLYMMSRTHLASDSRFQRKSFPYIHYYVPTAGVLSMPGDTPFTRPLLTGKSKTKHSGLFKRPKLNSIMRSAIS